MVRPQLVNGNWRKPELSGRNRQKLRSYFQQAGVPWIYDPVKPEVHSSSPYNRRPKGMKHEREFENRLAMIRKNLSTAD